ncbi:MAG: hypothetical protein M1834_005588 [Cirrosporium novae-zelandiae]|nr:MAG: hypothetical protein M1834_005588 [Cirrosporium novae-zelandiae]
MTTSQPPAIKRLMREIREYAREPNDALLHLGPVHDDELLQWEAVLKGVRGSPYEGGLWLLSISIPPTYPLTPPKIKFLTPICHPNIDFRTGDICLSLLGPASSLAPPTSASSPSTSSSSAAGGWTPAYTISSCMSAIQQLLTDPGLDSPLNVDVANLYRKGDAMGAEGLVRFFTAECRWVPQQGQMQGGRGRGR